MNGKSQSLLRITTLHRSHHYFHLFETLFKLTTTKLLLLKKFHHRPMKKKGGTAAGVPRSTGETPSAITSNGAPRDQVCHLDFHPLCFCGREKPSLGDAESTPLCSTLAVGIDSLEGGMGFHPLLSAACTFFFSHCHSSPSLVSDQKSPSLYGYLDLGATTRRGTGISNHANFSGCGFGPRTLPRFGG